MFITEKVVQAFNRQITQEYSNYLQYTAIANYFSVENLRLLAGFYAKQAEEERDHASRFTKFLIDSGAAVEIQATSAPQNKFANALEAVQSAYDAEVRTTNQIHALVDLALSEKCHSAQQFLQWFVQEQVEEIATAESKLAITKKAGNNLLSVEAYLAHGG